MRARCSLVVVAVAVAAIFAMPAPAAIGADIAIDLTGAQEVPGPGDSDATGSATLNLKPGKGTVCFDVTWADIDGTVVAGHIHVGPAGVAGPVVIPLPGVIGSGTGSATQCLTGLDKALVKAIRRHPKDYYVNIHSDVFPAGAIRGQLG